jgi:hypothetical protein
VRKVNGKKGKKHVQEEEQEEETSDQVKENSDSEGEKVTSKSIPVVKRKLLNDSKKQEIVGDPENKLDKFRIDPKTITQLNKNGIIYLFPI